VPDVFLDVEILLVVLLFDVTSGLGLEAPLEL